MLALVVGLSGCGPTTDENVFFTSINAARAARGLPALTWDDGYHAKALEWSTKMADESHLYHSPLATWYPSGWQSLGENVGDGPDTKQLAAMFLASPAHYAHIVDPKFKRVSIGVVKRGVLYWVTEVFIA